MSSGTWSLSAARTGHGMVLAVTSGSADRALAGAAAAVFTCAGTLAGAADATTVPSPRAETASLEDGVTASGAAGRGGRATGTGTAGTRAERIGSGLLTEARANVLPRDAVAGAETAAAAAPDPAASASSSSSWPNKAAS